MKLMERGLSIFVGAFLMLLSHPAFGQGGWQASYYSWQDYAESVGYSYEQTQVPPPWIFQQEPAFQHWTGDIRYDWGWEGAPLAFGQSDYFAIRFTTEAFFAGRCHFDAYVDDGIRILIDGQLITDPSEWRTSHPRTVSASANFGASWRAIEVQYFERDQRAQIELSWQCDSLPMPSPPVAMVETADLHFACVPRWTETQPWWVAIFREEGAILNFHAANNQQVRHPSNPNGVWAALGDQGLSVEHLTVRQGGTNYLVILGYGSESLDGAIRNRSIHAVKVWPGRYNQTNALCSSY